MHKKLALILVSLLFISGCTTGPSIKDQRRCIMNAWIGYHASELIAEVGPPDTRTPNDLGGEILTYDRDIKLSSGIGQYLTDFAGMTKYTTSKDRKAFRKKSFYTDSEGYIRSWKIPAT